MKKMIIIVLSVILLLSACSKANDPYNPQDESILQKVQTYNITGQPVDIDISDDYIFIAEDLLGFSIFNRSMATQIIRIDELPTAGQLRKSIITKFNQEHKVLFVFDRTKSDVHSLHSLNFETPTSDLSDYDINENLEISNSPQYIRSIEFDENTDTNLFNIYIAGFSADNILLQGTYNHNDSNLQLVVTNRTIVPNAINKIVLTDTHIITAMGQRGVYIIDKFDINNHISQVDTPGDAQSIVVKDNIVYVADLHQGLQLVDITDITNPVLLDNSYNMSGEAVSIDIHNNHLAVASNTGGLYIYDISDILSPKLLERKLMSEIGYLYKVQFYQDDLYVASRDKGVIRYSFK
jgi:hypothetical protein